jgi:hypothetical protein
MNRSEPLLTSKHSAALRMREPPSLFEGRQDLFATRTFPAFPPRLDPIEPSGARLKSTAGQHLGRKGTASLRGGKVYLSLRNIDARLLDLAA